MTTPRSSPYVDSWIVFTQPVVVAGHDGSRDRDPRAPAYDDVVTVELARLHLGEADPGDLRVGVDRARYRRLADGRVVTHRVLGGDLALTEARVRELPVAGHVPGRVDVRHIRAPVVVRPDPTAVERDAGLLEADPLHEGRAADGDEHEIALDRLALAEMDGQMVAVVVDLRALLREVQRDVALLEGLLGAPSRRPRPRPG